MQTLGYGSGWAFLVIILSLFTGNKFPITMFPITKFLIAKFLVISFVIYKVPNITKFLMLQNFYS
jgi:hypothetical protein